jgi:methionyl aminopeptidase
MINIKSPREIELMRKAGAVVGGVFDEIEPYIVPGASTLKIANIAEKYIRAHGASPTFKGYGGFSGAVCTSVNDIVIHGIPSKHCILKEGDILSVDVGATLNGFVGDACRTYPVGKISPEAAHLIETTKKSFYEGIALVKDGALLGDVSHRIEEVNLAEGFSLLKDYCGHGVGRELHEDPNIPNYGPAGVGPILKEGMCLAIEPMVAFGDDKYEVLADNWAVRMKDGKYSAHYENSIVVTKDGCEILTLSPKEKLH